MRKYYIMFMIIFMITISCNSMYKDHITGNFYLVTSDTMDDLTLSYYNNKFDVYEGIVSGGIYLVETNNDYILVQKHPYLNSPSRLRLNTNITEYYIVRTTNSNYYFNNKECFGPYNKEDFETQRNELKIADTHEFYSKH